jgi:autotransporter-associated beta strand protein
MLFDQTHTGSFRAVPRRLNFTCLLLAIAGWLLLSPTHGSAATRTWTGALSVFWSNSGNWGGTAPANGDDLVFPAGASQFTTINNMGSLKLNSITFSGAAGGYSLTGNAITLTNGISSQNTSGLNVFGLDVTFGSSQNFEVTAAGGSMTVSGDVDPDMWNFTADTTGTLTLSGVISGSSFLKKQGAGKLTLTGGSANTFPGGLDVHAGTVDLSKSAGVTAVPGSNLIIQDATVTLLNNNQIGDTTALYTFLNATLDLNDHDETLGDVHFRSSGAITTGTGTLTLNGTLTNSSWTTGSSISGNLALGSATRIFHVDSGTNAIDLNVTAKIIGAGGITKTGDGVLSFGGTIANAYTGDTLVQGGRLELDKAGGNAIPNGSLTVSNAATVREMANFQLGSIPLAIGTNSTFDLNGFNDTIGASINLDRNATIDLGGGTLSLLNNSTISNLGIISYISNGTLNLNSGPCTIYCDSDLEPNCTIAGSADIYKVGSGIIGLIHSNSFTGTMIVSEGIAYLTSPYGLGATNGGTIVSNGASLYLGSISASVTNETLTLNGKDGARGALIGWTGGTNVWAGPVIIGSATTLWGAQGNQIRIIGPISGSESLSLGGTAAYQTNFSVSFEGGATNTYYGTTFVYGASLILSKSVADSAVLGPLVVGDGTNFSSLKLDLMAQIHDSVPITLNSNAVFDLNNISDNVGSLVGTGSVSLGSGTLGLGSDDTDFTFSGSISGSGGLTKHGTGTMTLTGTNTYSGTSEVANGMLVINGVQPQSPVLVDAVGRLSGGGTVGIIKCPGRLYPGDGIGILTSSNLVFTASGDLLVDIAGPVPGTGYDQIVVRGTNSLANAVLHVLPAFTTTARLGQKFTIIVNDGADAIAGTFAGLPESASLNTSGYGFTISYIGGTGNDVQLTLTDVPAGIAASSVSSGNGNKSIDPNECNNLTLVLTNKSGLPMANIRATLSTTTAGVLITQPYSAFPDLPINGAAPNTTAFQISALPSFPCGSDITLQMTVDCSAGTFVVPATLHTGFPSSTPARYDFFGPTGIPDIGTINSIIAVAGFVGTLEKVTVSCWLAHPRDSDLDISLVSPDGVVVSLASGLGGLGSNYGTNCTPDPARTVFDDFAGLSVTAAFPPFVGVFKPQASLSAMNYGAANGNWRLRVADNNAGSLGALQCWSLFLFPPVCPTNNGGACIFCSAPIGNSILAADPVQFSRLATNGIVASCGAPKSFPGIGGANVHYDSYTFTNTSASNMCVTVLLTAPCDLQAVVYLSTFNPLNVALNYLGDSGGTTLTGPQSCSVIVPPGATYVVTVNEAILGAGCPAYSLQLSGLPCPQPVLNIQPVPVDKARLFWPTWAGGYILQSRTNVSSGPWFGVTNEPLVNSGQYNVTNSATKPTNNFYRLEKP